MNALVINSSCYEVKSLAARADMFEKDTYLFINCYLRPLIMHELSIVFFISTNQLVWYPQFRAMVSITKIGENFDCKLKREQELGPVFSKEMHPFSGRRPKWQKVEFFSCKDTRIISTPIQNSSFGNL